MGRPRYSQAQKARALEHNPENGRCVVLTLKGVGYPSRALLPVWVKELHPETRVRVVGRSQGLTPAMKQSAVIVLCMRKASAKVLVQALGVPRPSLYNWKHELLGHTLDIDRRRLTNRG